ncbi:hypothetical protein LTR56_002108 [Elasticomyces elasticus]|nr:hypothetical protein LTR56_002108 [Elasticomyces elasticus]KAK3665988.1 hypothetical protein LTR22_002990 [Elasticomyces elasticus]KAK4929475.1 hypothetical protein LTR49_003769 [Elasticomyces elasticus]KAK5767569.1 hypothetical protein LTS12_002411 [Elasticomyces elasticus]
MRSQIQSGAVLTAVFAVAQALDGVTVPSTVAADNEFQATFQNANSDSYRVYLAASLVGANGPTCYLQNSTSLSSPVSLTIPSSVGPSAGYYSIAIADLTTSGGPTYSNRFNLTGGTGNYTEYESHLGGAPFWDADDLPCSSYECARQCAQAGYPTDLTDNGAYETMRACILKCPGVSPAASVTGPAHGTASSSASMATQSGNEALVTLGSGPVLTAIETTATISGSTFTEAILGSMTITLGGAAATVSSQAVSMLSNGIEVGGTTTVPFASMQTSASSSQSKSGSATNPSAAATSSASASRHAIVMAGLAGVAGVAAMLL